MKPFSTFIVWLIILNQGSLHAQDYLWAKNLGSTWGSVQGIVAAGAAAGINNNLLVAGGFQGTADFDPGPNAYNLTVNLLNNGFVASYDAAGSFQWAAQLSSSSASEVYAIVSDHSGNFYITGTFSDTTDFDFGPGINNLVANGPAFDEDIFLAKYSSNGSLLWAHGFGSSGIDRGLNLAVSESGDDVWMAGYFRNTVDFDPGPNQVNLTSLSGPVGSNLFFARFDPAGNLIFAKSLNIETENIDIAVHENKSCITGMFNGTVDFDPSPGNIANQTGVTFITTFFGRYDETGNYLFAHALDYVSINNQAGSGGKALAISGDGSIFMTGQFSSTADFDPGPGNANQTAAFGSSLFLVKYDSSGSYQWVKTIDVNGGNSNCIALDAGGNALITGFYYSTADFDPGPGTATLSTNPSGVYNMFMARYSDAGLYLSAKTLGGYDQDYCTGAVYGPSGDLLVCGNFTSTSLDMDPGSGSAVLNITPSTFQNIFFGRYAPSPAGITNVLPLRGITVYPNPSTGLLNLNFLPAQSCPYTITDAGGQLVQKGNLLPYANFISMGSIRAGQYLLNIKGEVIKIIIR